MKRLLTVCTEICNTYINAHDILVMLNLNTISIAWYFNKKFNVKYNVIIICYYFIIVIK